MDVENAKVMFFDGFLKSTPTSFICARGAQEFLNVCFDKVESNVPIELLAPLV